MKKKNNTAEPPRTREGLNTSLPHNGYPGGKIYRKAMHRLKLRNEGQQQGKSPDKPRSHKRAGSMTK